MSTILLTGGSGFLGKIIYDHLSRNEDVKKIGRKAEDDFKWDLKTKTLELKGNFKTIIHSAGKAHSIPITHPEKKDFFNVNVNGTINLLKGLKQSPNLPKAFIFISSVAVYGLSQGTLINEQTPLKATDPYGQSKIQSEQIIQEWCGKNNVICTILRLPLLVGENPPGNLGAMIKGIRKGYYFNIGNGAAKKSMVMAEDVARFILPASEIGGIYNLTDGYHPSFKELSNHIATQLHKKNPLSIPQWAAKSLAKTGDLIGNRFPFNSYKLSKIQSDLTFDDTKARNAFAWNPKPVLESF